MTSPLQSAMVRDLDRLVLRRSTGVFAAIDAARADRGAQDRVAHG